MKSDATPIGYTSNGLEFSDGTEIPADLIVFTTGFVNMRKEIAPIVGEEIAEQLEEFWGVDREGEILGAFKPSGRLYHPPCRRDSITKLSSQIRGCGIWVARWGRHATCHVLWLCRFRQMYLELLLRYIGRRPLGIN